MIFSFYSVNKCFVMYFNAMNFILTELLFHPVFQMLHDCPKARREVELHWRASSCTHIVKIVDVYENLYQNRKCLLIVMEWWVIVTFCVFSTDIKMPFLCSLVYFLFQTTFHFISNLQFCEWSFHSKTFHLKQP